ncbi:hypothetical protein NDU88_001483 [Pleurodeles waltl]|uniref:Uncharacterized protein n=1 Tax=Pleurodeles waltl TaxID=8319 RepID=A0AAV7NDJ1_PLEWA|nr:hypothetical protein NDU88_001483 [Pleurodeles waltl]
MSARTGTNAPQIGCRHRESADSVPVLHGHCLQEVRTILTTPDTAQPKLLAAAKLCLAQEPCSMAVSLSAVQSPVKSHSVLDAIRVCTFRIGPPEPLPLTT